LAGLQHEHDFIFCTIYGHTVTSQNLYLDFDEGSGELTAEVNPGKYSLTEFAQEVKRAIDDAGTLTYTVTIDRSIPSLTISAGATFELLTATGSHAGASVFSLSGFAGPNRVGLSSYSGAQTGSVYHPQFKLQSYVSSDDLRSSVEASINESASGELEIVTFGTRKKVEFNFKLITNILMDGLIVKNNSTALGQTRLLMQYLITKSPFEMMYDEEDRNTFETLLLDSTTEDSKGTSYRLKEMYDRGLPNIFETGLMKFRVIE